MTGKAYSNTRRYQRHSMDAPIRVIVHRTRKTTVFLARGNELSEGGMALTAGVELNPGDETEIEFTPPYSRLPIRIRGIVRNRAGHRYGMEFVAADARENEQVDRLRLLLVVMSTN